MIVIKLREALNRYKTRTGSKLTYEGLATRTGISVSTLQSIAARSSYNTTLSTIEKLCIALQCQPGELLAIEDKAETKHAD